LALSQIEEIGHDEDRENRRLGDDERHHADLAAVGQTPGRRCFDNGGWLNF
jgi:hypothetical protein